MVSVIDCLPGDARRAPAAIIMRAIWDGTVTRSKGGIPVIGCLPEERRDDLTARRTRMKRGALPAPVRADGTVPGQHFLNHGEESPSDGDEALGVRPVVVLGQGD